MARIIHVQRSQSILRGAGHFQRPLVGSNYNQVSELKTWHAHLKCQNPWQAESGL